MLSEPVDDATKEFVARVIAALGDRLKVFCDILSARCFFSDEYPVDAKNFEKRVRKEGIPEHLAAFSNVIATIDPFTVPALETALQSYCESAGLQSGDLIHALRLATTGQPVGPGVYDCLVLLGREKSLVRIANAIAVK
ncbi:MAG: hypothetical protein NT069_26035 [Planctomycetota bacterium]|nr:hypothetical protein [Planctomycetota bacterium]